MDLSIRQFNNTLDYNSYNIVNGKSGFRIFYSNIRSLRNKINDIEILVNNYKADIIVLTETWINETEKPFYNFTNYISIYSCRKRQGGGLGLFIHDSFEFETIEKLETENHGSITIKIDKLELIIFAIYRPPSYNVNEFFDILDEKINSILVLNYKCIILGDMNIDLLSNNVNSKGITEVKQFQTS